jgi:putative DNA primase/helicase
LIPFTITIPKPEQDKGLPEKLEVEQAGILRWAVEGCTIWQKKGLGMPDEVKTATEGYREEMDIIARFLAECTFESESERVQTSELYRTYKKWCEDNGERPLTGNAFGRRMTERGVERDKDKSDRYYMGISLEEGKYTTW